MGDEPDWIRVATSDDVPAEVVVDVSVDDCDLVVWRTADGTPCVMDARCPHQHSHLAAEGAVNGDEIICCTHWWRFSATGEGSYEGADGTRAERAPIVVHPSREDDDGVWVQIQR